MTRTRCFRLSMLALLTIAGCGDSGSAPAGPTSTTVAPDQPGGTPPKGKTADTKPAEAK